MDDKEKSWYEKEKEARVRKYGDKPKSTKELLLEQYEQENKRKAKEAEELLRQQREADRIAEEERKKAEAEEADRLKSELEEPTKVPIPASDKDQVHQRLQQRLLAQKINSGIIPDPRSNLAPDQVQTPVTQRPARKMVSEGDYKNAIKGMRRLRIELRKRMGNIKAVDLNEDTAV